jgi:RNA polymerase primary sigma factor
MSYKKYATEDLITLNNYFKEIKKTKLITPEEEVELAIRIEQGDEAAIHELVKANLRFVVSIAKEYKDNGVSLSDLISEGNYGLIKAAKRFDHTRGLRFISYGVWWIKQAILQYLNEHARTIRLPVNILSKIYQLKRELNSYDINAMDIEKENSEYLSMYPQCASLNHIINEEGDELVEMISDDPIKGHELMVDEEDEMKSDVRDFLDILEKRERDIIIYYYGLNDADDTMTLETIGDIYGLTKERVRQIKGKAIKKLRANIPSILKLSE